MAPTFLEGQMLGRYRMLEPLGRGGMARVYRAYHSQLDRYVAIKVLRSDLVEDEEFLTRFRREAQAVAALRHPNIVQVFDFDVQGDVYYMVMELLEGDTLKTRLNDYRVRGEQMALGEVVRIHLDVLDGLSYAHSEGMVHRDIKPANILLTRRGQAVVADFGIAHIVGGTRHTISGALMGTLNYMAPEQGLEGHSDARSDIYSLGIVFYEMLTQRPPFEADTPLAVLMKHVNDPLPLPRKINSSIPEPFERIVLKSLAKRPEGRYQSAEEMAQALREAAEEAGVELPSRISLPLSFTTAEAPSESVAVFSGTARERIADAQFADDDTDATLGRRLAVERAEGGQASGGVGREFLSAAGALGRLVVSKTAEALRQAVEAVESEPQEAPLEPEGISPGAPPETTSGAQFADSGTGTTLGQELVAESAQGEQVRGKVVRVILGAVAPLGIGNLAMLTVAGVTGWWEIFEIGWPVELFLAGTGLCAIMNVTAAVWMLIPVGILLGNGVIFSYCTLTGNWDHWSLLWLPELWVVIGTVGSTIWLARLGDRSRRLSRPLGRLLGLVSAALSLFIISVSVVAALVARIIGR
jgi:tRNA A-37 threonylcarbamoyl transferase component Bud32